MYEFGFLLLEMLIATVPNISGKGMGGRETPKIDSHLSGAAARQPPVTSVELAEDPTPLTHTNPPKAASHITFCTCRKHLYIGKSM